MTHDLLDPVRPSRKDGAVAGTRALWVYVAVGLAVGLALGILVSVTTDVPFAPEIGVVVGAAAGWTLHRLRTKSQAD
jgi:uncharacterized membrane-anchored protein YhcB (DUF1043 family)